MYIVLVRLDHWSLYSVKLGAINLYNSQMQIALPFVLAIITSDNCKDPDAKSGGYLIDKKVHKKDSHRKSKGNLTSNEVEPTRVCSWTLLLRRRNGDVGRGLKTFQSGSNFKTFCPCHSLFKGHKSIVNNFVLIYLGQSNISSVLNASLMPFFLELSYRIGNGWDQVDEQKMFLKYVLLQSII